MNDKDKWKQVQDLLPGIRNYCLRCSRLSALGMMSSFLMHDIRNSLTIIFGLVQLTQLEQGEIEREELDQRLEQMVEQIEHIQKFINNIGRFSERSKGESKNIVPDSALDKNLKILRRKIDSAGLNLEYRRSERKRRMRCDATLFDFVLLELLTYSLFQHSGSGSLIVQSSESPDDWKVKAYLRYPPDTEPVVNEEDDATLDPFVLTMVRCAMVELGGTLEILSDRKGWEVILPWNDEKT